MLNKLSTLVAGTLLVSSIGISNSYAGETLAAQEIARIINYGNKVTLGVETVDNLDNCTRAGDIKFVAFDSTTAAGKQFLAMALTAKASEAEVVIATNGCIPFGSTTIPKVFRIEYR